MENTYSQQEKVKICMDIIFKLKNFKNPQNIPVDLFNENYTFVKTIKTIFNDYIRGDTYFKGTVEFEEIGKQINYHLPLTKNHKPLFFIKIN